MLIIYNGINSPTIYSEFKLSIYLPKSLSHDSYLLDRLVTTQNQISLALTSQLLRTNNPLIVARLLSESHNLVW